MQKLPHRYSVVASASEKSTVTLGSPGLSDIESAAPAEFGGPGDLWSPETLFAAAVADCFLLTFRAIAKASSIGWDSLECSVDAELDRVEKTTKFTNLNLHVTLKVPADSNEDKCLRLLQRAEDSCLITNSINATSHLIAEVQVAG